MELTDAQKKALDVTSSICVTAGAGTGKTFILSERYRKLLEHNKDVKGFGPANILALTFTEKAAAEMRERIEEDIRKDAEECEDPKLRRFYLSMLDEFFRCNILTFHGFCNGVLREFAFESGMDPSFGIMDEIDRIELIENLIQENLSSPPEYLDSDVQYLYRNFHPGVLAKLLEKLLERWHETSGWFDLLNENPEFVISHWKNLAVERSLTAKNTILNDRLIHETLESIKTIGNNYPDLMYPSGTAELWQDLVSETDPTKIKSRILDLVKLPMDKGAHRVGIGKPLIGPYRDNLTFISETIPEFSETFMKLSVSVLLALGHVAGYIFEKQESEKKKLGVLDFDDLIFHTQKLITENSYVLSELQERFRYVLVDEVQDNDPALSKIVTMITDDPESDKLFVVGDAKQCIYGFRGADVSGINQLKQTFSEEKRVELDVSFRTVPEIIEFVNYLFERVLPEEKTCFDVRYEPLKTSRSKESGSATLLLQDFEDSDIHKHHVEESELLAKWIVKTIDEGKLKVYEKDGSVRAPKFGDIAILIEKRTHLDTLTKTLDKFGIPSAIYKGTGFYRKQEIYDFLNLATVLLNPEEDTALYGVLRSPYFGISDAELCRLRRSQYSLWYDVKNFAKEFPDSKISFAGKTILAWKKASMHLPLTKFLRMIYAESEIFGVYAGLSSGKQMIANLEKLSDIAGREMEGKNVTFAGFVSYLKTCVENAIDETEAETVTENRVQILTIHASKGLEFPIVCVCFAGDIKFMQNDFLTFREDVGVGISIRYSDEGVEENSMETFAKYYQKPEILYANSAERKRQLYVALTRAKDHLVISGCSKKGSYGSNSYLSYLDPILAGMDREVILVNVTDALPEIEPERKSAVYPEIPDFIQDCGMIFSEDNFFLRAQNASGSVAGEIFSANERSAMLRGDALHAIFAGADPVSTAERYGISSEDTKYFAKLLDEFYSCSLYSGCIEDISELPILYYDGESKVLGVVDRVVKHSDGRIFVVDFKSGSKEKCGSKLLDRYRSEVLRYVAAVEKLFGEKAEGYLYFPEDDEKIVKVEKEASGEI